jgi:hypothetical protein
MTMRRTLQTLAVLAAVTAAPLGASAQDMAAHWREGVGMPMKPSDAAAGPWRLRTDGKTVCTLSFSDRRAPSGVYGIEMSPNCASVLPPGIVGWKPVTDGLALVGADPEVLLVDFNQWTPHDLVARRNGAPFLELIRR